VGTKKLFVGGLPWGVNDDRLNDLFLPYGKIKSARVCLDRDTGKSRGFGFVEFDSEDTARLAMDGMDGAKIDGRAIRVSEAEERRSGGQRLGSSHPDRERPRMEAPPSESRPGRRREAYSRD
jgi:RNA recognition motif-containing protein